jgi:hypothetical protein
MIAAWVTIIRMCARKVRFCDHQRYNPVAICLLALLSGNVWPGWNDDGNAFCKAPAGLETKCATLFNFAEVLPFDWWTPCCLKFCTFADGYQNKAGTWCG